MNLYSELLDQPSLRFDFSSAFAEDMFSRRGLRLFGPYDSSLFPKDKITAVVLYQRGKEGEKAALAEGLKKGEGKFGGFQSFFKVPLEFVNDISFTSYGKADSLVDQIAQNPPNVVYVLLGTRESQFYSSVKSRLLANGVPSQMVTLEKLKESPGRQYVLENIALASYAKVGGTPWTVSTQRVENDLILGVSRAHDRSGKFIIGYVTLFTKNGDFLFMNSGTPAIEWESYVQGLSGLLGKALDEFEREFGRAIGTPSSIVVHFNKKPGKRELEAIEKALTKAAQDIQFAIIHLNEYSNFRLFDSSHGTYIPPKGLKVSLSGHEALLLLDGRVGDGRRRMGMPRVLDVRMDKRSTMDVGHFPELAKQIYDFAHVNWRGFNSAAVPITLNYSKLIARMVVDLGVETWNQVITEGQLRDKAWFL